MQDKEFFKDAQNVCANAIDLLIKCWPKDAPAETYRDTLQGLNRLQDYFIENQEATQEHPANP